jgi:hypothetical protein
MVRAEAGLTDAACTLAISKADGACHHDRRDKTSENEANGGNSSHSFLHAEDGDIPLNDR